MANKRDVGEARVRIIADTSDVEQNLSKMAAVGETKGEDTGSAIHEGVHKGVQGAKASIFELENQISEVKSKNAEDAFERAFGGGAGIGGLSRLSEFEKMKNSTQAVTKELQERQKVTQEVAKQAGLMSNVGEAIDKQTEGARKFVGALSGSVGILTGLLGTVTAIGGVIGGTIVAAWTAVNKKQEEAKIRAEEYKRVMEDINNTFDTRRAALIEGNDLEIERLRITHDRWKTERELYALYKDEVITSQELYDLSYENLEIVRKELAAIDEKEKAREAALRRESADRRRAIQEENDALEAALLTGEEKIRAQRDNQIRSITNRLIEENDASARDALERQIKLIEKQAEADIQAHREAEAEKTRVEAEEAKKRKQEEVRQAQLAADALASITRDLVDQQTAMLTSTATGTQGFLQRIEQQLYTLNKKLQAGAPVKKIG